MIHNRVASMIHHSGLPALSARGSRRTRRAQSLECHFDALEQVSGGQPQARCRRRIVKTDDAAAAVAGEMRMLPLLVVTAGDGVIAPDAVVASDTVGKTMPGQPFEHAVKCYAVDLCVRAHLLLHFGVAQRTAGMQQDLKDPYSWLRDTGAARADEGFSGNGPGGDHRIGSTGATRDPVVVKTPALKHAAVLIATQLQ